MGISNIEEAIEILKEIKDKEIYFNCSYFTSGKVKLDDKDKEAIDIVLKELDRLQKEVKEYEKDIENERKCVEDIGE